MSLPSAAKAAVSRHDLPAGCWLCNPVQPPESPVPIV